MTLIERIEAASGSDRGLDAEIHFALHKRPFPIGGETWDQVAREFKILKFTGSIDAACALVPKDWTFTFLMLRKIDYEARVSSLWGALTVRKVCSGEAATPALALCAAALKARGQGA